MRKQTLTRLRPIKCIKTADKKIGLLAKLLVTEYLECEFTLSKTLTMFRSDPLAGFGFTPPDSISFKTLSITFATKRKERMST